MKRRVFPFQAIAALALAASTITACSKPQDAPPPTNADAAAAPAASASAAPAAKAGPVAWTGSYNATPGTLFVPDGGEWSGVKFRGEDASTGLGAGTLSLTIDPFGRAEGTGEGPLGALLVHGLMQDDTFRARLDPKNPNDGFTGTAVGKREGDSIKGEIHLSQSTGNIIREGTFTLAKSTKN